MTLKVDIYTPILTGDEDKEFFLRIIRLYEDYEEIDSNDPDDFYIPFRTADIRYDYLYWLVATATLDIEKANV